MCLAFSCLVCLSVNKYRRLPVLWIGFCDMLISTIYLATFSATLLLVKYYKDVSPSLTFKLGSGKTFSLEPVLSTT